MFGPVRVNVVGVIVLALIASLKVAVTVVVVLTPEAPLDGVKLVTVGAVVKDQVTSLRRALPARSLTPVLTVAV